MKGDQLPNTWGMFRKNIFGFTIGRFVLNCAIIRQSEKTPIFAKVQNTEKNILK